MRILKAASLCLLLCAVTGFAAADAVITDGTYLSYLGENNHLYLLDDENNAKVLRAAITDLVGMDDMNLYCLTAENRLYAVRLDGSGTSIVSAVPDAATLASHASIPAWTIEEGKLYRVGPEGNR